MTKKKILFTGGGSAGHVTLNLNLIPHFQKNGWETVYVGSEKGIEVKIISNVEDVKYYSIKTGKLRRYFSWQNFLDLFKIPVGILQAFCIIRKENPDMVFSKGGFVSFPVVAGAWLNGKKAVMHESDMSVGLSNKLSLPFVYKFFTTFAETTTVEKYQNKMEYIGPVMSDRLLNGNPENARKLCKFIKGKPVILVVGGSLGAESINAAIRTNIKTLLEDYQIIHVCGKGMLDASVEEEGYRQFEFVSEEFKDFIALSDLIVSRAGSNALFEILILQKPMLLVPLPANASRGEQVLNARALEKKGCAEVILDEKVAHGKDFVRAINKTFLNKEKLVANIKADKIKITSSEKLFEKVKGYVDED